MGDRKFYWLKLKKDFFHRHDIEIIESMENGKDYVLFYLKMMLESVSHDGRLRFSDAIPYDEKMLSVVTRTNVDVVRAALGLFQQLGMVDVLDDQTIYMTEVEKIIGCENASAERQRRSRANRSLMPPEDVVTLSHDCHNVSQDCHTEIEIELEKEIDTELDNNSVCAAPVPDVPPVYALPLVDKTEWNISQKMVDEWADAYPAVDVLGELKKMRVWLNDNPTRRKTKKGIRRFVSAWLAREQDRGRRVTTAGRDTSRHYYPQGGEGWTVENNRDNFAQMAQMRRMMEGQ